MPLLGLVARAVRALAVGGAAAAALIAYALLRDGLPDTDGDTAATVLVLLLVAAPPVVLFVFYLALREAMEVPGRLRRLPEAAREQVDELSRLARDARAETRPGWRRTRSAWRLRRAVSASRDLLGLHAPIVALASLPFLTAAALSAAAAVAEIGIALIVLIVLAF